MLCISPDRFFVHSFQYFVYLICYFCPLQSLNTIGSVMKEDWDRGERKQLKIWSNSEYNVRFQEENCFFSISIMFFCRLLVLISNFSFSSWRLASSHSIYYFWLLAFESFDWISFPVYAPPNKYFAYCIK